MKITTEYTINEKIYNDSEKSENYNLKINQTEERLDISIAPKTSLYNFSIYVEIDIDYRYDYIYANSLFSNGISKEYKKNENFIKPIKIFTKQANKLGHYFDYNYFEKINQGKILSYNYCYFRAGENIKMHYSIDENECYTLFSVNTKKNTLTIIREFSNVIDTNRDILNIRIDTGVKHTILQNYFHKIKDSYTKENLNYMSSYENHKFFIHEQAILKDIENINKDYNSYLIEDGYSLSPTEYLKFDKDLFPNGLEKIVDVAHNKGIKIGLYIAPLLVSKNSFIAQKHQDYLLKYNGINMVCSSYYDGSYMLDISNQNAREYIKDIISNILVDYKVDFLKIDSLYIPKKDIRYQIDNKKTKQVFSFIKKLVGNTPIIITNSPFYESIKYADFIETPLLTNNQILDKMTNKTLINSMSIESFLYSTLYKYDINNITKIKPSSIIDKKYINFCNRYMELIRELSLEIRALHLSKLKNNKYILYSKDNEYFIDTKKLTIEKIK